MGRRGRTGGRVEGVFFPAWSSLTWLASSISFTLIQLTGTVNTSVFSRQPPPGGLPGRRKRPLIHLPSRSCRRFLFRFLQE